MFKSEKMLLRHPKNKKQHIQKNRFTLSHAFLWNGDRDKSSFLKGEAEPNSKTNCETLNVTSLAPSLSQQQTLPRPGLLPSPLRTRTRQNQSGKNQEGRNQKAYTHTPTPARCSLYMGNSICCEFRKPNPQHLLRQVWRWCKSLLAQQYRFTANPTEAQTALFQGGHRRDVPWQVLSLPALPPLGLTSSPRTKETWSISA